MPIWSEPRRLTPHDFAGAQVLYAELMGPSAALADAVQFGAVLDHPGTVLWGADADDVLAAMVTLHLLPNMTWGGRPYALIENVVTATAHRGTGLGAQVMRAAINAAWQADAYKIMLLTGQQAGATGFYERLGFRKDDKFGMTLRRVPTRQQVQQDGLG